MVICTTSHDAKRLSGAVDHGQGSRNAGTPSSVPLVMPPLCVPVHPTLDVQMSGILQRTDVLG